MLENSLWPLIETCSIRVPKSIKLYKPSLARKRISFSLIANLQWQYPICSLFKSVESINCVNDNNQKKSDINVNHQC